MKSLNVAFQMVQKNRLLLVWIVMLVLVTYYLCNQDTQNPENFVGFRSGPQAPITSKKNKAGKCGQLKDVAKKCTQCHGKDGKPLLPVLEPMFNMREMCKQIILLEDHLFQTRKRCEDCICKHFLTIEALAEEALTLDKNKKYLDYLQDLPDRIREIQDQYIKLENKDDIHDVAQKLRVIRKEMMTKSFTEGLATSTDDHHNPKPEN
jgi:hypothetical protein